YANGYNASRAGFDQGRRPRASEWHFNDSPVVDISSKRQLLTEALETAAGEVDSLCKICKSARNRTHRTSNYWAYYWQSLELRQVQRAAMHTLTLKMHRKQT
ncbi:MAG TPA: hypothetical protein VES70_04005, partial [Pseudomonas sp.]|nr:hypothetical protein [Pseudomonas sp.]